MSRITSIDAVHRIKMVSLVLGAVILGLGLHSHYQSAWVQKLETNDGSTIQLYSFCSAYSSRCPDIAMERYFVGTVITCFILSVVFFAAGFAESMKSGNGVLADIGYQVLGGLLLVAAGIVYMISANKIYSLMDDSDFAGTGLDLRFRFLEKRIVSSLTIIQGALLLTTARLLYRNSHQGRTPPVNQHGVVAAPYPQQQNMVYYGAPPPYHQAVNFVPSPQSAYAYQQPNVNYGVVTVVAQPLAAAPENQSCAAPYPNEKI